MGLVGILGFSKGRFINHVGVREIPLGAKALGCGIGEMQGGFRKLARARDSTPSSSKVRGIRSKW